MSQSPILQRCHSCRKPFESGTGRMNCYTCTPRQGSQSQPSPQPQRSEEDRCFLVMIRKRDDEIARLKEEIEQHLKNSAMKWETLTLQESRLAKQAETIAALRKALERLRAGFAGMWGKPGKIWYEEALETAPKMIDEALNLCAGEW